MALILVTGASSGLGRATARALAEDGHEVVLHARRRDRLDESAVAGMRGIVTGDLGRLEEIRRVAEQADGHGRFDAVIHNAGVLGSHEVYTVNVLAPYLLTALMTPPGRAIVLSSSMHRGGDADLDVLTAPDAGGRPRAYDTSKLMVTAFAMAMARLRPGSLWHAVDPGWVPTRMGGPSATDDLAEGHRTQTWLATAPESEIRPRTGGYWHHRAARRPHPAALDVGFRAQLLDALRTATGLDLP
jgi:NAD(P)-dependent dehydrogenase (short-subunit alcohol dehydrogenase family)